MKLLYRITVLISLTVVNLLACNAVCAQSQPTAPFEADASFAAFNANFLERSNGYTYYNNDLNSVGNSQAKLWTGALDIAIAEDNFERTHADSTRQLIKALLDTFLTDFGSGKNWSYDGWNDDIGWMINALLRGFKITGDPEYLDVARKNYDMAIGRGWDDTLGGGIYENDTKTDKECLSNDPFISEGVGLYEATGDPSYLTEAEKIYEWVRTHLFNPTDVENEVGEPGRLRQGEKEDGSLESGDNFYNSGTFLEAANALYQVTGKPEYFEDATLDMSHVMNDGPVLHNNEEGSGNQWAYWVFKGLSDFCTDNNLWPKYYPWMLGNANAAWNERDTLNLTWNDWTSPTTDDGASAMEMSSAVALWQLLDIRQQYAIYNKYSGLAMDLQNESDAADAPVIQWQVGNNSDTGEYWSILPADGHYILISGATGMAATISNNSTVSGAGLEDSPYAISNTSQQFDRLLKTNDCYLLRNVASGMNLDDSQAGKTDGSLIVQREANGLANQLWKFQPYVNFGGEYEIQCAKGGYALGDSGSIGAAESVVQSPYKGDSRQLWNFVQTSMGYYEIRNLKSGMLLGVSENSFANGAQIAETTVAGTASRWFPGQTSAGAWTFYNLNSGSVLDNGGATTPGAQLNQWGWNGGLNQQFKLIQIQPARITASHYVSP